MMILAAALIAPPALSNAAPRTIDDCEKIDAADAYNQCLAAFGPVAHTHGVSVQAQDEINAEDGAAVTGRAASASSRRHVAHAHGHYRHHASRHVWTKHAHGGHHVKAADHPHGHGKRLAFTIVSSHTKLR